MMKRILHIILIFLFSLTVISCGSSSDSDSSTTSDNTTTTDDTTDDTTTDNTTTDTTAPVIAEVTAVTTPTNDTTPAYTFSSTEAGTITYGGNCTSSTTSASSGNNAISFSTLSEGTYSDCTIMVTDSAANVSSALTVSSFTIDTTAPSVSSFTLSDTALKTGETATVTLVFSEAVASFASGDDITVANGSLDNMSSSDNITWAGTFTPTANTEDDNNTLSLATSYTDTAGNAGPEETTEIYEVDTTAPTVSSVSTTADNQSSVSITDNISVTFSESMEPSYVTTSTSDTNCAGSIRVSSDNFSSCVRMSSEPASSNSNMTFTLDPHDNLTVGTTYKTRVTTGVKDTAGNSMSSQYETSSGFTPADLTAPTVTFSPTDNATGVEISDNITISFNEAVRNIDDSVLTDSDLGSLITLKLNSASGDNVTFDATVNSDKTVITINPTSNLPNSQAVYVSLGATVEDSTDNVITAANATFITVCVYRCSVYVNSSSGDDNSGDGSSGSPYKTFHKGYTEASSDDIIDLTGTFTWTDAAESGDAATTGYTIAKNLTIQGQGVGSTTIQAHATTNTADRGVFYISATVTIKDLTIQNGVVTSTHHGGGITNNSTTTLEQVKLSANRATFEGTTYWGAGGVYNKEDANLNVTNSTFDSNIFSGKAYGSGGLYSTQSVDVVVVNSTFSNNQSVASAPETNPFSYSQPSAALGAFRFCNYTITNSTFTQNSTNGFAGAIQAYHDYTFIITNSTIVNNSAGTGAGGVMWEAGSGNYKMYVKNTIISDNEANSVSNDVYAKDATSAGQLIDNGYNIVETSTNKVWNAAGDITGNQTNLWGTGVSATPSLANNSTVNGTQTLALSSGSVGIDAGNGTANNGVSIPATDQRGVSRSGATDIGAYEYAGVF